MPPSIRLVPTLAVLLASACTSPTSAPSPPPSSSSASSAAAAAKASAVASSPPRPPSSAAASSSAAPRSQGQAAGVLATEYRGTLGDGVPVVVRLHLAGDRVTGSYFYERAGGSLALTGSTTAGHLSLEERADQARTGTFEVDLGDDGGLHGTWTDAHKPRSLPVALAPIPVDAAAASALVFKRSVRKTKPVAGSRAKDEACKVDLESLEVFGLTPEVEAKVNARLALPSDLRMPEPCDHAVEMSSRYTVALNADGLLSVRLDGSVTDAQAAHPDSFDVAMTVLLATGADVKVFGDLLPPASEKAVRRELTAAVDAAARKDGWDPDAKQMVVDGFGTLDAFLVDRAGIRFCASVPHVAAALGGCDYLVPAAKLPRGTPRAVTLWGK